MDNQLPSPQMDQPVTAALQSLQDMEQNNLKASELKRKQLMQNFENTPLNQAAISQAMAILGDNSTAGQVGKAIQSPKYAGYCQQFIDDRIGATERYPSAAATWQAKVQNGQAQTDISKAQPGDVIEFAPDKSNGGLGHAALVTKNGLQMATYNGVQNFSLKDWISYSGQTPQGFYSPSK